MKKFLLCLVACTAFIAGAFAKSYDEMDSEKIFGITPGARISVLGLEPTVAVDFYNLEVEAACAFSSGFDGKQFGAAPSFSVAYITNPFEKGISAAFGAEYMFLTPSYTNMLTRTMDKDDDVEDIPGIHMISVFYKGAYNFNHVFGLLWRIRLPLMIGATQDGESLNVNVTNLPGFAGCFLVGICTTSIGVKFTF